MTSLATDYPASRRPHESSAERPESLLRSLKPFAEAAVVFTSLAFVAGWSYLTAYYANFGVGLFDLDISVAVASVFAVRVIYQSKWLLLAIALTSVAFAALRRPTVIRPHHFLNYISDLVALACVFAAGLVLAVLGVSVGNRSARLDIYSPTSRLPSVAFVSTLKADYPLPTCLVSNTLDCRLLAHSKGYFYVFEPIIGDQIKDEPENIQLYILPDNQVQLARVQRGLSQ